MPPFSILYSLTLNDSVIKVFGVILSAAKDLSLGVIPIKAKDLPFGVILSAAKDLLVVGKTMR